MEAGSCDEGPVETDPSQRYLRYSQLLGRGACKRVYKAFDQELGIEVAWNQVELAGNQMQEQEKERLFAEIRVLKSLTHKNIIAFKDWWYDAGGQTINFITEYFTSGTLRQYRKKHRHISEQAMKRWAYQILEGLVYLHAHVPPIIHRDLKCDNILVNGTSGVVKVADLGLASVVQKGLSVVGTPEFMAPEVYDEVYDEKVDIYSFGMCMLELATMEYPYAECKSIPAIFRKVSQGIPPAGLAKIPPGPLHSFIKQCISFDAASRPGALALLKHPFFDCLRSEGSGASSPSWSIMAGSFSPVTSSQNLATLSCSSPKYAPAVARTGSGLCKASTPESPRHERGKSVCIGLLATQLSSVVDAEEDDSDDEVLVHLEDVLEPHPDDTDDDDTSCLITATTLTDEQCGILQDTADGIDGFDDPSALNPAPLLSLSRVSSLAASGQLPLPGSASGATAKPASATSVSSSSVQPARTPSGRQRNGSAHGASSGTGSSMLRLPSGVVVPLSPMLEKMIGRHRRWPTVGSNGALWDGISLSPDSVPAASQQLPPQQQQQATAAMATHTQQQQQQPEQQQQQRPRPQRVPSPLQSSPSPISSPRTAFAGGQSFTRIASSSVGSCRTLDASMWKLQKSEGGSGANSPRADDVRASPRGTEMQSLGQRPRTPGTPGSTGGAGGVSVWKVGGGGIGRIVVRRKFANRAIHPSLMLHKRSNTL